MRCNPDILRDIMLAAEQQPAGKKLYGRSIKTTAANALELADHVQLLIEAGYIDGKVGLYGPDVPPNVVIDRIRYPGHEFLQAMRDDTIWRIVKEKFMIATASWTLALAVDFAIQLIRKKLLLP